MVFYEPGKQDHGLPRDPFRSLVVPRPIAWITSRSLAGVVNLAPYSHFNICAVQPPAVMFAAGTGRGTDPRKDSQRNAEETGEFVVNVATFDLREQMNLSSAETPATVSEVPLVGLSLVPSRIVQAPRIAESPVQLECKHLMTVSLPCERPGEPRNAMVIGQVVGIHISDAVLTDGFVDIAKLKPVARLGYMDYAVITSAFTMLRPTLDAVLPSGLAK
jgi:flavin reductase (DIM6/NTAB) family NADH-FMN oxidoreductase RutF